MSIEAIGTIIGRTSGREMTVYRGYDDHIIGQLIEKSQEPRMLQRVPKDRAERFASPTSFGRWVRKEGGRLLYTAQTDTGDLAATCWLGKGTFPHQNYPDAPRDMSEWTYAIRTYEGYEQNGIAKRLSRLALRDVADMAEAGELTADLPPFTGVWLETNADDQGAIGLYENMVSLGRGFETVGTRPRRVAMALAQATLADIVTTERSRSSV